MVKVRTKCQPRHEIEVPEQEAEVLRAQGLLFEGDLEQLLASDPTGPLDPRPEVTATAPEKAAAKQASAQASPADAKPADTGKGA